MWQNDNPGPAGSAVPEKVRLWERRLLDLSLRNTLLNLRPGRGCLPIAAESGAALEALLAEGRELPLCPWQPEAAEEVGAPDAFAALEALGGRGLPHCDGLCLFAGARELDAAAKRLYRAARTAMDESGTGTLFAGIGMLRWTDERGSGHVAPLVLVPVALHRRRAGWALARREGEAEANVTLLEKLKREYGIEVPGLEPLPRGEGDRIDLEKVRAAFRAATSGREDWTVFDQSALANFAYGAFVMWSDLRRREAQLASNPITGSLITGIRMARLEAVEPAGEPYLPLPTDATQLAAVRAARQGESFVLHGPPGTGKSQTITTLIANLLADGRRVLFVAEKQAALDVVKARLDAIGIGGSCVSLHAASAGTRSALDQVQHMLELPEPPEVPDYAGVLVRAGQDAESLDAIARAMHEPMGCGIDLYTAVQRREALDGAADIDPLGGEVLDAMTPKALEEARRALRRMVTLGRAVDHPARFPLRWLDAGQFEAENAGVLAGHLEEYRASLAALGEAEGALAEHAGWARPRTAEEHLRLAAAATDAAYWAGERLRPLRQLPGAEWLQLLGMANHFVKAGQLRAQLERGFRPEFLEQDGEALYAEWKALDENPLLSRLRLPGLLRRVNSWALKPLAADSLWVPLRALQSYQAEKRAGEADYGRFRALLGDDWRGGDTDWATLRDRLAAAQAHAERFGRHPWLPKLREDLLWDPEALALARNVEARMGAVNGHRAALGMAKGQDAPEGDWLEDRIAYCDAALAALGRAGDWLAWLRCAEEARAMGLDAVVRAYEGGLDHDAVLPAFEKALHGELAARRIDGDPALARFTGRAVDALAAEFRALDAEAMALSRAALARRLYERRRDLLEAAENTPDLSRLRRACASKRPGRSLRQLFAQMPGLMGGLCGCMLMSPVSVAQFLPDALEDFDAVIFDEASQLLTCRAMGALSRAKSAIVVGDPNQMPPTTFFSAAAVEADDPDLEDLESILEDCLAVGMPNRSLLWHYRSRHESLIAFSNQAFYDGRLITFPSVDARAARVRSVPVDGVFERSGRRVNRAEAQAVTAELVRRAHDVELARRSAGVVTFNRAQQEMIEDMVSDAAASDDVLAAWIDRPGEPLFIKNLENVQGDERDAILFSVGYGPDAEGAVHMNFGPLNREGGWRQLNVAVTRAREEMLLFTSLRPGDIRATSATARGVTALRDFMEYAERGGALLPRQRVEGEPDGIADAVCAALAKAGWQTERDVGRSDFRVSIAVADPAAPERFRLGILLDDRLAGRSARDREIGRASVLEGLGWKLTRLYALDWRRNPAGEAERLLGLLGRKAVDN